MKVDGNELTLKEEAIEQAKWLRQMAKHPAWKGSCGDSLMPQFFESSAAFVERLHALLEEQP